MQNKNEKNEGLSQEKKHSESDWAHDIEKRDYYYDDSTGYEVYDPDAEPDAEEETEDEEDLTPKTGASSQE